MAAVSPPLSFLPPAVTPVGTPFCSPVSSSVIIHTHEWVSIVRFGRAPRIELQPLLVPLGFRANKHTLIRCSYMDSPISFESETGMVYSLFREIGFDKKETEILLDKNPAIRFMPFESIRRRIRLLKSIGVTGLLLCRLIGKCPDVVTAEEMDGFICFLQEDLEGTIEPAQLVRLLIAAEPRFLKSFEEKVRLLIHHGIPEEKIAYVLNNVNLHKALCLKPVNEIERMISFLSRFGGVSLIVKRPKILNFDLDSQLIPRIEFLVELSGGDVDATGTVLRKLPAILSYSVEHTESHVKFLRTFAGLSDEEIFRIVLIFPNVISASKEQKLHPRIEFLKQCKLDSNDIYKFLIKAPLFLGLSFEENLAYKLAFLVKIGYRYRTKELAVAMGAVTRTSSENLQKVIGLFSSYGLSSADILAMSKKHPQILQYNHSSLEEKMEYLIEGMGREVGELLAFPAFLGYKLDDRIKHRYEVKKKILGEGMSLNKLLTVSTERFGKAKKMTTVNTIDDLN